MTTVRLINDDTGWTATVDIEHDDAASVSLSKLMKGGFGIVLYFRSGEVDPKGLPIFRTRQQ